MFFNNLPQKLALVLCLASALVYSDTVSIETSNLTSPPIKSEITSKNVFTQFLRKNLQVSLFKYDGSLGLADFFVVGERHHYWGQLGCLDKSLSSVLGIGSGYRYLFKEDEASNDWFLGAYVKAQGSLYAPLQSFKWQLGVEVATHYFQGTLSRYSIFKNNIKDSLDVPEEAVGYSFKLSTSWFKRFNAFKNIQPFVILARTKLGDTHEKSFSQPIWNTGIGTRWQLPYITFEIKAVWDALQKANFLGLQYHFGCQINLIEEKNVRASDVRVRIKKRPESYIPLYYKKDVVQEVATEISKNNLTDTVNIGQNLEVSQVSGGQKSMKNDGRAQEDHVLADLATSLDETPKAEDACKRWADARQEGLSAIKKDRVDLYEKMQKKLLKAKIETGITILKILENRYSLLQNSLLQKEYASMDAPMEKVDLIEISKDEASLEELIVFCNKIEGIIKKSKDFLTKIDITKANIPFEALIQEKAICMAYRQEGEKYQKKIRDAEENLRQFQSYHALLDSFIDTIALIEIKDSLKEKRSEDTPCNPIERSTHQIIKWLETLDGMLLNHLLEQIKHVNRIRRDSEAFKNNQADVENSLKGAKEEEISRRLSMILKKRADECIKKKKIVCF